MPKMVQFGEFFWKPEACGQTELPDRSDLIGQKLVENAKIKKFICDILGDFQTLWTGQLIIKKWLKMPNIANLKKKCTHCLPLAKLYNETVELSSVF